MERKHPHNRHTHSALHKHRPAHAHMLKLSPETTREQKSNGDVREKEGGNEDVRRDRGREKNESGTLQMSLDLDMPLLEIVLVMRHSMALQRHI